MSEKSQSETDRQPVAIETLLAKIEQIVAELEDGRLGLTESMARYEEGVRCLKQCYSSLEEAERRIELLAALRADGSMQTEPFAEDEAASLEEKRLARGRRRSGPPRPDDEPNAMDDSQGLF